MAAMKPVLLLGLVAAAALASCKGEVGVRTSEIEKTLSEQATQSAGTPVTATCPDKIADETTTCTISAADGTHAELVIDIDSAQRMWAPRWKNVAFGKLTAMDIQETFSQKYGLRADSVTCPAIIVSGGDTQCHAHVRTMTLPVDVATTGGNLGYSTSGGMVRGSNAEKVATELLAKNGGGAVTCDFDYRWAVPGETFTCQSTRGVVLYTIKDDGGIDIALDTGPAKP